MIVPPDDHSAAPGPAARQPGAKEASKAAKGRGAAGGISAALEAQLLREKKQQYARSVREQLARRHRDRQAARVESPRPHQQSLPSRPLGGRRPSPGASSSTCSAGRRSAPAQGSGTPAALQAILSVAQRLEDKLAALPEPGVRAPARPVALDGGIPVAWQSPRSYSSLSSLETPSVAGSIDSLPSAWGLHASKKLRKLVRQRQPITIPTGREEAEQSVADPFSKANLRRLFGPSSSPPGHGSPSRREQEAPARPAGGAGLAERLLQSEAGGDPFSIINLYLEEQADKQRARQAHQQAKGPHVAVSAAKQAPLSPAVQPRQAREGERQQVQRQPGPAAAGADVLTAHDDEARPVSAASNQENVSANAELERLAELQDAELELAQLEQSQIVGAAQREIDTLAAALDRQATQHLLFECNPPVLAAQPSIGAPAPAMQPPTGALTDSAAQQVQLLATLHISQQQQLTQIQQQLSLLQLQHHQPQPPLPSRGVQCSAPEPAAAATVAHPAPLSGPATSIQLPPLPLALVSTRTAPPLGSEVIAAEQQPPALSAQQTEGLAAAGPAAEASAAGSKQQYVQRWLAGATTDDQGTEYSVDPDHVDGAEGGWGAAVAAAVELQQYVSSRPTEASSPAFGSSPPPPSAPAALPPVPDSPPARYAAQAAAGPGSSSHGHGPAGPSSPPSQQVSSESEYSMSFEEDAEWSYTDQYTTTTLMPGGGGGALAAAATAAAVPPINLQHQHQQQPVVAAERPASPRQLSRLASPPSHAARPTSPTSPRPRCMSPHGADDPYPTPPRSPHHVDSCPGSPQPTALVAVATAADGPGFSRPGSPSLPAGIERRSPSPTPQPASPESLEQSWQGQQPQPGEHCTTAPPPLLEHAAEGGALSTELAAGSEAAVAGVNPVLSLSEQQQPKEEKDACEEPASPPTAAAALSPGSPRVEDDTVVQSEEHTQQYVQEVLDYFWEHRAAAYARGEQPLDLEGFLHLERRRPAVGDPQHIFNKLLFDAVNEALAQHYNKTLTSFAGKVAPERALLDRQRVSAFVAGRVLGWAGMGCTAADVGRMLEEDAAEDERTLTLLTEMMLREIEGASRAASPSGVD